jgi:uncharacterized membrane protein (DUF373 family)
LEKVLRFYAYALVGAAALALFVILIHIGDLGYLALTRVGHDSTRELVEGILDGFVLIELLRSFADYLSSHKMHLFLLLETALVFVLREISSGLYAHSVSLPAMLGYAVLILALVLARSLSCRSGCDDFG